MIALLPLSLPIFLLTPALAAPAAEQEQEQQEQEQVGYRVAQAKKFMRNQWYDDAAAELRAALDIPAGRRSWAVWWLALQIDYARGDIPGALDHATGAVSVAATPEERDEALRFRAFLLSQFGFVDITGPAEGAVARVLLAAQSPQLDPDLRARAEAVALLLRRRHTLGPGPLRVGLPPGTTRSTATPSSSSPRRPSPSPSPPPISTRTGSPPRSRPASICCSAPPA